MTNITSQRGEPWRGNELEAPAQFAAAAPFLPKRDAPSAATFEHPPPGTFVPKRSSFVVLRGGKGDAELTERRASATAGSDPLSPRTTLRNITPPRPTLEHRNSLKPFLEADGEDLGNQEEWERGLQDERTRELSRSAQDQRSGQFAAPFTTPPLSHSASFSSRGSPFNTAAPHTRSNTLSHTQSIASITSSDAWNGGGIEDVGGVLRRHHSLDFRSDGGHGGESSSDEGWSNHGHDRQAISEDLLSQHGHALGNVAGFANSRPGTGPPSLNLAHGGLSHSSSLSSHRGSLSHSNSLTSSSHHSHNGHSGALSPVGGFPRSPWSPTVEETKQLGMGAVVGTPPPAVVMPTLSRGGSTGSRGSSGGRYGPGDDVGRLGDDMAALEVAPTPEHHEPAFSKPPTPPGLDIRAAVQTAYGGGPSKGDVGQIRQPVRSMTTSTISPNRRLPPLMTNPDVLASLSGGNQPAPSHGHSQAPSSFASRQGPASAAAYVPPIGHSHPSRNDFLPSITEPSRGNFTAAPGVGGSDWALKKEMLIGGAPASAFPNAVGVNPLADAWPAGGGFGVGLAMQQQQQIQILQSQMQAALQAMDMMKAQGHSLPPGFNGTTSAATPVARPFPTFPAGGLASAGATPTGPPPAQSNSNATADSPIDIPSLVATKGYNPQNFDLRPPSARFFVIKSYTEEDVHKSLKYEIWASTDLGNKRLDRAFRESADKGPIYLFFSVNGSGHFAGMAQMLTPVDYAMSSNVWASDKWKGVLKVKWIYIKDVPLASLRHIRLSNTPENKPVTSSRDTQEVPYDAGLAVLGILASYNSRTSLLQDFAYYNSISNENQAAGQGQQQAKPAPPAQPHYTPRPSPAPSYQPPPLQQHQFQYQHDNAPQMSNYGPPYPNFRPDMSQQHPVAQGGGGRRFHGQGNGAPGGY
ncbi:hypothetical protein RQP46_000685 [Phenoliferia psychrophenolica]